MPKPDMAIPAILFISIRNLYVINLLNREAANVLIMSVIKTTDKVPEKNKISFEVSALKRAVIPTIILIQKIQTNGFTALSKKPLPMYING